MVSVSSDVLVDGRAGIGGRLDSSGVASNLFMRNDSHLATLSLGFHSKSNFFWNLELTYVMYLVHEHTP